MFHSIRHFHAHGIIGFLGCTLCGRGGCLISYLPDEESEVLEGVKYKDHPVSDSKTQKKPGLLTTTLLFFATQHHSREIILIIILCL